MLVIRTRKHVVLFATAITVFSLLSAELLNILMFQVEILKQTMIGTFVIVSVMSLPTASWIGHKIRENTALTIELRRLVNRDRLTDAATRDFFLCSDG